MPWMATWAIYLCMYVFPPLMLALYALAQIWNGLRPSLMVFCVTQFGTIVWYKLSFDDAVAYSEYESLKSSESVLMIQKFCEEELKFTLDYSEWQDILKNEHISTKTFSNSQVSAV